MSETIIPSDIVDEMRDSYMEYAMSVIAVSYTHLTLPTKA
mgnify:CR=1 FL=1